MYLINCVTAGIHVFMLNLCLFLWQCVWWQWSSCQWRRFQRAVFVCDGEASVVPDNTVWYGDLLKVRAKDISHSMFVSDENILFTIHYTQVTTCSFPFFYKKVAVLKQWRSQVTVSSTLCLGCSLTLSTLSPSSRYMMATPKDPSQQHDSR